MDSDIFWATNYRIRLELHNIGIAKSQSYIIQTITKGILLFIKVFSLRKRVTWIKVEKRLFQDQLFFTTISLVWDQLKLTWYKISHSFGPFYELL